MLRRHGTAAAVALCLLLPASPAFASGAAVLKDCASGNGSLSKTYSQKDYAQALKQMPTDLREYSDCEAVIRHAMLGLQSTPTTPGATSQNPTGGSSPQEVAQANHDIAQALRTGGASQRVGGAVVRPGALAFRRVSAGISHLPTPLLVVAVLIVIGTLLGGSRYLRSSHERTGGDGS